MALTAAGLAVAAPGGAELAARKIDAVNQKNPLNRIPMPASLAMVAGNFGPSFLSTTSRVRARIDLLHARRALLKGDSNDGRTLRPLLRTIFPARSQLLRMYLYPRAYTAKVRDTVGDWMGYSKQMSRARSNDRQAKQGEALNPSSPPVYVN